MFPVSPDPQDEGHHASGPERYWSESWYFDFAARDGSLGGYVRIGLYPNLDAVWYWACLVGEGRPLVAVIDHEVPRPLAGSLEVRTSGLWADHNCEAPLDHWSLALEAFAVSLDDPADAYGSMWGHRVPLGLDLEWETEGDVFGYPPGLDRYEVPCRVHGEVLVGPESIELDALGQRDHSWGVRDWWERGWCWTAFQLDDGSKWHAVVPDDSALSIGYAQLPDGTSEGVARATVDVAAGPEGIPIGADLSIGSGAFTVDPVAWAPILLTAPDGGKSRFPRSLARFRSHEGPTGVGWIEFNQPQSRP
jgi:hypothetical protein